MFGLVRWWGCEEVVVRTSGPHAGYVLDVAQATLGRHMGPDWLGRDHPAWREVASVVGVDEARRMALDIMAAALGPL